MRKLGRKKAKKFNLPGQYRNSYVHRPLIDVATGPWILLLIKSNRQRFVIGNENYMTTIPQVVRLSVAVYTKAKSSLSIKGQRRSITNRP